jgi:hypothetical protein
MAQQVKTITSEALEAAYRNLTPSQEGFTEDLMASNTIIPVLDMTPAAEGTSTPEYLQRSYAFGSITAWDATNSTVVLANTPGFYQIIWALTALRGASTKHEAIFSMSDGLTSKTLFELQGYEGVSEPFFAWQSEFNVFLSAGESISATSDSGVMIFKGSIQQVADVNGNLVYPSGFTPQ